MATLDEVNARLKRIEIKGKQYVQVNQRILGFWELCPIGSELHGAIVTEKLGDDGKRCDFIARVYINGELASTGHAFEYRDAGMVNKTSYVENAETSAIGRALGVLGIGATESLASAEEMQSALAHQENQKQGARANSGGVNDELQRAKAQLWAAEQRFCELNGIPSAADWHREVISQRPDYAETVESMAAIAAELLEVMP